MPSKYTEYKKRRLVALRAEIAKRDEAIENLQLHIAALREKVVETEADRDEYKRDAEWAKDQLRTIRP